MMTKPSQRPLSRGATSIASLGIALILAGCSGRTDPGANLQANVQTPVVEAQAAPAPQPAPAPASSGDGYGGATIGGDGSAISLAALEPADIDAAGLDGELACSFSAGAATLLLAKGDVGSTEPARGVVKVGSYVEAIAAPGGFDAIVKGATFSGKGKTIRIALTGPALGGGESPPNPGDLIYDRADGGRRTIAGRWSCGP